MGNFNRGGGFGGRGRGSNRGGFGGGRAEMHKATCTECGSECEVPFRPTGDRPVLCSACFKGPGRDDSRREERRDFDRPRFEDKKMFDATCASCGERCQVPFMPRPGKEVFCSTCFGKGGKGEHKAFERPSFNAPAAKSAGNYDKQFEALNVKLNKILELLNPEAKQQVINAVKEIYKQDDIKKADKVEAKNIEKAEVKPEIQKVEVKAENKKEESKKKEKKPAKKADKKEDKKKPAKKAAKKK